MKKMAFLAAALLALSAFSGCSSREAVPLPAESAVASASQSAPEALSKPEKRSKLEEHPASAAPSPAEKSSSGEGSSSKERMEPWEKDSTLRPPLERKEVPADTQSVTIATDAEKYALADELPINYTIVNNSTQVLTYLCKYVVELRQKDQSWTRVDYPADKTPDFDRGVVVLNPGEREQFEAPLYRAMLKAGTYRIRCGVWVYEYEVNTEKDFIPDSELGRFDLTAEFAVA